MNIFKISSFLLVLISLYSSAAFAAGEAKNLILFIGDGMGPVTITASRIFAYGESGKLTMDGFQRTARVKTFSKDAQTTDSAPSMAAYMTGVKMNNEVLSMSADTKAIAPGKDATTGVSNSVNNCGSTNGSAAPTLLEQAIASRKATGVVSTARLTHATPAAVFSHVCNRNAEYEIARQAVPGGNGYNSALGNGVDVLLGGVSQYWIPYSASGSAIQKVGRPDGRDLIAEMKSKGYSFVNDRTTLDAAPTGSGSKILGLFDQAFSQGHMSYDLDRDPSKEPSLSEMTAKAIDLLSKNTNGYVLVVEGGRIDHALHGTNAKRALVDTIALDNAIKVALSKVSLADTLVVVTADHDHTMAFNGYSKRGNPILDISRSYVDGLPAKDAEGKTYTTLVFGQSPNRPITRNDVASSDALGNDYLQEGVLRAACVGCETHGGGDVQLFASGPAALNFRGTIDNTKVYSLLKTALGL
jgi:alkaline phosphatase